MVFGSSNPKFKKLVAIFFDICETVFSVKRNFRYIDMYIAVYNLEKHLHFSVEYFSFFEKLQYFFFV